MRAVRRFLQLHWPLALTVCVLYLLVASCVIGVLNKNNGRFVYTLDDAYIHMAIAKNFAQHGVWGVTDEYFTSSSSSLLWTALIAACYFVVGVNVLTPFILNILIATALLIWLYYTLRSLSDTQWMICATLLASTLLITLPGLIFTGLEHILHTWMTLITAWYASRDLAREDSATSRPPIQLYICAPLVILSRFEGLFLVFIICCLYLIRRRILSAFLIGGIALLPIVIYGFFSMSQGWWFLPNSVILKGSRVDVTSLESIKNFFYIGFDSAIRNPYIIRMIIAAAICVILLCKEKKPALKPALTMCIIYMCTAILHVFFADFGWFCRYESYLVGFGIVTFSIAIFYYLKFNNHADRILTGAVFMLLIAVVPFDVRSCYSITKIPIASNNIYDQQYQMARFVKRFYNNQVVALNDIGAVNFYADIHCVDMVGLSNRDIANLRINNLMRPSILEKVTASQNVRIAIVYNIWFPKPPESWIAVGEWIIKNNVVCGSEKVSFYATNRNEAIFLNDSLKEFSRFLPEDVIEVIYTLE